MKNILVTDSAGFLGSNYGLLLKIAGRDQRSGSMIHD